MNNKTMITKMMEGGGYTFATLEEHLASYIENGMDNIAILQEDIDTERAGIEEATGLLFALREMKDEQ